jgi:hypothetical protein
LIGTLVRGTLVLLHLKKVSEILKVSEQLYFTLFCGKSKEPAKNSRLFTRIG